MEEAGEGGRRAAMPPRILAHSKGLSMEEEDKVKDEDAATCSSQDKTLASTACLVSLPSSASSFPPSFRSKPSAKTRLAASRGGAGAAPMEPSNSSRARARREGWRERGREGELAAWDAAAWRRRARGGRWRKAAERAAV